MGKTIELGKIKPEGWLRESIEADMKGCIGNLDKLAPLLLVDHQIYGRDRLHAKSKQIDLGVLKNEYTENEGEDAQFKWWNSESQSNWRDGFCRASFLLEDPELVAKAEKYIEEILSTQQDDGYLGIYAPELRFVHTTENGELWAQSTLFRVLLGCYEATGDERILAAVIRAMEVTMVGYPVGKSDPFNVESSFSGHCHGLTIVDSLNNLFDLTGDQKYLDYAVWLYENYSKNNVSEEDIKIANIENHDYFWKSHGVHTYEQMRAVIIAAYYQPEQYKELLDLMLAKLPYYLTPSGGPIGDEWILSRTADATATGYEFCSVMELFNTYALLLQKSNDFIWGDKMEWLYYNTGHGMKHPIESSIMYCKTDNCYSAAGKQNLADSQNNLRYLYSPLHQKSAVCCVPNMGRLMPYFVQSMYLKQENGFSAVLFGASAFCERFKGVDISIRQITNYPASNSITFEISVLKPIVFEFDIRIPKWAKAVKIDCDSSKETDRLVILREWSGKKCINVEFSCEFEFKTDFKQECFVTYGPLLYALPIPAHEKVEMEFDIHPFRELTYEPISHEWENFMIRKIDHMQFISSNHSEKNWKYQMIMGCFFDGKNIVKKEMMPIGGTILRKSTFKTL